MHVKDIQAIKDRSVSDFLMELPKQAMLQAAQRIGCKVSATASKASIADTMRQVYVFMPQVLYSKLTPQEQRCLKFLWMSDLEAPGDMEGMDSLAALGVVLLLDGDVEKERAVISRELMRSIQTKF